jgi:hypothetical protein
VFCLVDNALETDIASRRLKESASLVVYLTDIELANDTRPHNDQDEFTSLQVKLSELPILSVERNETVLPILAKFITLSLLIRVAARIDNVDPA